MRPKLGQFTRNKKYYTDPLAADMESREIKLSEGQPTSVTPNLLHDHTNPLEYIASTGNLATVTFNNPINTEELSLHFVILDNTKNTGAKTFNFGTGYIFMDDPTNTTNSYTVNPGKTQIWWGPIWNGKLYLRVSIDSTN